MFTTALLIRWTASILIIILLMLGFYILLKFLKEKDLMQGVKKLGKDDSKNKLEVLEKVYIDSKNKVVKVKDGNKVFTILLGENAILLDKESLKKEQKQKKN
ncbi:MAG: hypothetical protein GY793_05980 [Proteobacteria bacterium]|nr:hypothetical protein [Pseudomonadota bacterium]